jgi:nucleotide-binding universal stress UspA family protein
MSTLTSSAEFAAIDEISAQMKVAAEKSLAAKAEEMKKSGLKVSYAYTEGSAANEIISYADANACDLIAMATHGKGEIAWVLGSVAEKVISHASVPVLVLRVLRMKAPDSKDDFMFKTMGPD